MKLGRIILVLFAVSAFCSTLKAQEPETYELDIDDEMCEEEQIVQNAVQENNYLFANGRKPIYSFLDSLYRRSLIPENSFLAIRLEIDSGGFIDSLAMVRDLQEPTVSDSSKLMQFINKQQPLSPAIYTDSAGNRMRFEKSYLLIIWFCPMQQTRMGIYSDAIAGPGSRGEYGCIDPDVDH